MRERYRKVKVNGRYAWIQKDREDKIRKVEGLIFDCDGVIFDVSKSFKEAILKTVEWFFGIVLEVKPPSVNFGHIQMFKNTGAFNNDWELTYAITLYYLTDLLAKTGKIDLKYTCRSDVVATCSFFKELGMLLRKEEIEEELESYVNEIGAGGLEAAKEKAACKLARAWRTSVDEARRTLEYISPFAGDLYDRNIIKRFFEEVYCGSRLFEEIYGVPAVFYRGKGLIENEKPIVKHATLRKIFDMGFPPIGIASGRMRKQTLPLLEKYGLKEYFDLDASTFLEEIEEKERELGGGRVKLDKPNPYPLTSTAFKMGVSSFAYVGDTVADIMACINAEAEEGCSVVSVGVLCSAKGKSRRKLLAKFLELRCDVIIATPNELPEIIEKVKK